MDCSQHKGHKRYVGGPRDGEVVHLVHAAPSDYPQTIGSHMLGRSTRNWYELDYDASEGTEAVYPVRRLGSRVSAATGRGGPAMRLRTLAGLLRSLPVIARDFAEGLWDGFVRGWRKTLREDQT